MIAIGKITIFSFVSFLHDSKIFIIDHQADWKIERNQIKKKKKFWNRQMFKCLNRSSLWVSLSWAVAKKHVELLCMYAVQWFMNHDISYLMKQSSYVEPNEQQQAAFIHFLACVQCYCEHFLFLHSCIVEARKMFEYRT